MLLGSATTVDFSGVTMPFNVGDLLDTAMSLVGLVAPFILLGIAIMFAPSIINFIKGALGGKGRA